MSTVILGTRRTPFGKHHGLLSHISAPQLAAWVVRDLTQRDLLGIDAHINGVFMGQVLTAGVGQNPARQVVLHACLPLHCSAETFNKVCSSSLVALEHACRTIALDEAECMLAGGMESMSRAPHLSEQKRKGMGSITLNLLKNDGLYSEETPVLNSMLFDGLCDSYTRSLTITGQAHMGEFADRCAKEQSISREEQDDYAYKSCIRARRAQNSRVNLSQIVPISSKDGRMMIKYDECLRTLDRARMSELRPCFTYDGTVTPATSAQIADGAAVLALSSLHKAYQMGIKPLARILSFATYSTYPEQYPVAPAHAIKKLLEKTDLSADEIDFFEINEAFAVVPLFAMRELNIPEEKVNPLGGAIAIGHPLGATGARLVGNIVHVLQERGGRYGIATTCNGGGEAVAVLLEKFS